MGVRISDTNNVCLYDSTTGYAFGPVFESLERAEEFLEYLRERDVDDPRRLPARTLHEMHERWAAQHQ